MAEKIYIMAEDGNLESMDETPFATEVKRGSDTEIRLTIVGQPLEYAAHATITWGVDDLRSIFEQSNHGDHTELLAQLLQIEDRANSPQPKPRKQLTHRQRAQDWVREGLPEGVRLTEGEILVLYEFTFWVGKTSFRIKPHVRPSPTSKGVLAHCDMDYNRYLKIVASLQKKGVLVKIRQGGGSRVKGRIRHTEWELPVEHHLKTTFQEEKEESE